MNDTKKNISDALLLLACELAPTFPGGEACVSCAVESAFSSTHWYVHATAVRKCASGATFEEAVNKLREELGQKTPEQLATELREQAKDMLAKADALQIA